MAIEFQASAWEARDTDDGYLISVYGRTEAGKSVSATTVFNPYFFIQVPSDTRPASLWAGLPPGPIDYSIVGGKTLMGFTNSTMYTFMKLNFTQLSEMRQYVWVCKRRGLRIFESAIDPLLRFMHRTGIQSTGWLKIDTKDSEPDYGTRCDIKLWVPSWKTMKPVARDDIAPFKIASLDIECFSKSRSFPSSIVPADTLFQIAISTKTWGSDTLEQVCFTVGKSATGTCYSTEKDMLDAFTEYIVTSDPDVITGWNIFGFDMEYILTRMILCKCDPYTLSMGRRRETPCELVTKQLCSGALGSNELKMVPMSGRYIFDLFQTIKAEHKLESYSLNNVSKEFLGDQKNDMPIHQLFALFEQGSDLTEVADYCIKDTELPLRIMEKLYTFENLIEMAKATWVPLSFLSERGQQIKVFSQLAKKARELGFMIPTVFDKSPDAKYEGATVLEAQCGAYYKPITALDFAGLYPSIMIAHNMCYSTLVMDKRFDNQPGVEYEQHGDFRFAQNVPSLLPEVLKDLKMFRKKAKRDMESAKGTPMYAVYNGKQLAYKISMNSVYGFTGASRGILPCIAIASSVTKQGRAMIQKSKEYVEEHYPGSKVRYGDSVMPGTPVLLETGPVCIETLGTEWIKYPGFLKGGTNKEQCELSGIKVWTHLGWQEAIRVIRHKCQKKIYRVLTHTGLVDVTEDHSLLTPDVQEVKPTDVTVGTELFHSFPSELNVGVGESCSLDQAYIYGINNSDLKLLEKIPVCIFSTKETKNAFLRGLWDSDGCRSDFVDTTNHITAQWYYSLLRQLGFSVSLNTRTDKPDITRITWTSGHQRKNPRSIKKLYTLHEQYDGYVYDIETSAGTFQAGVGQMIVKNTDSIMVEFDVGNRTGVEAIEYSWGVGEVAAQQITQLFKRPNELELEKVYCPYFLYSKKRYAAKMWVKNKQNQMECEKIDIKGLQVIRRDNCQYVRDVCTNLISMIMESNRPEEPLKYIMECRNDLLGGRVPIEKLILSKRLGNVYKERAPGSEPQSGDRVQFVLINTGSKKSKMYEMAEDPDWVREHNIPLDYVYYAKHQFDTPVEDLIEPLVN
jgi:DNA polymerase delta subunit 1